jgi:tetratricopeptide (TPR) repeat protein
MLARLITTGRIATIVSKVAVIITTVALAGCLQGAIDANQRQLAEQQTQLDQLKQQVAALQMSHSFSTAQPPPGGCDKEVMAAATHKGGARMAAGDTVKALGFYQDAVTACPTSAAAQLNLANTYESIGDRIEAVQHYRKAAAATGTEADAATVSKARQALNRPGSSS